MAHSFKLGLQRNQRSRSGYEYYKHDGFGFFNVWVGSPTHHRWWAFSLYLYFRYNQG